ncbi:MAG: Smr/MutS family protein, partial [Gemmatimonadota bacterium]|nr:Smr/MutS family protein [Gemmatimonadota bacterium]
ISGPNAGGKTVLLKSVGLFVALARSGVVPPVGPGTRLPFLGGPYAIIGDEQSIAASLSTFGAQARNLAEILASAGPDDLVLIDEIGSATDPSEGGALAAATLSALSRTVRLTIATTHLGDLKGLAEEETGAVNASLQFDSDRLQPTYRLEKYRPGRSYALEIAARLGVPKDVLADARARLDTDHRSLDELLARLEREQSEVDELRRELDEETASIRSRASELERREQEVEVLLVEARRDAEEAVESALKQARSDVEEAIRHLETEYAAAEPRGEDDSLRESRRAARDVVERGIRESRGRREALMTSPNAPPSSRELRVGDRVRWGEGSRLGVLVELRGDRGVVELDGVRLTMAADDLSPIGSETAPGEASIDRKRPRPRPERREHRPNLDVKTEIDLRGLRAEEVEAALTPVLDAAVVAELPWLRIIHGKGTGALRKVVGDLLDRDPRVSEHRTGDPREGGTGVTMVKFE